MNSLKTSFLFLWDYLNQNNVVLMCYPLLLGHLGIPISQELIYLEDRRQKYSNRNFIKNKDLKIDVKFDITELDLICSYILSENRAIRRGNIINLRNLLAIMDMDNYNNDVERLSRFSFINKGIEARLEYNLVSSDMIYSHISGGLGGNPEHQFRQLNSSEVDWVNKTVSEKLDYLKNKIDLCKNFCDMDVNRAKMEILKL